MNSPLALTFRPRTATPLALERETYGKVVELFDGMWLLATKHKPGGHEQMAEVNNRCFIYRMRDAKGLLVVNAVDPAVIPEVKALERSTGLPVRFIVSPGGGHHLLMRAWHDAFEEARCLLCPVRAPRTTNGRALLQLPRMGVLDDAGGTRHPLPEAEGILDVVIFRGLLGVKDLPTPLEGSSRSTFYLFKRFLSMFPPSAPADELWLHHIPTGTVIGGENLRWYYPKHAMGNAPFALRMILKPGTVSLFTETMKVGDKHVVDACWQRITAWPARTLLTYHDAVGTGFHDDAQRALRAAVLGAKQMRDAHASPEGAQ